MEISKDWSYYDSSRNNTNKIHDNFNLNNTLYLAGDLKNHVTMLESMAPQERISVIRDIECNIAAFENNVTCYQNLKEKRKNLSLAKEKLDFLHKSIYAKEKEIDECYKKAKTEGIKENLTFCEYQLFKRDCQINSRRLKIELDDLLNMTLSQLKLYRKYENDLKEEKAAQKYISDLLEQAKAYLKEAKNLQMKNEQARIDEENRKKLEEAEKMKKIEEEINNRELLTPPGSYEKVGSIKRKKKLKYYGRKKDKKIIPPKKKKIVKKKKRIISNTKPDDADKNKPAVDEIKNDDNEYEPFDNRRRSVDQNVDTGCCKQRKIKKKRLDSGKNAEGNDEINVVAKEETVYSDSFGKNQNPSLNNELRNKGGPAVKKINHKNKSQSKSPSSKSKTPNSRSVTPKSKSKTPDSRSKTPNSRSNTPVVKSKTPNSRSDTPVTKSKTPNSKAKTPVMKSKTPISQSAKPNLKNVSNSNKTTIAKKNEKIKSTKPMSKPKSKKLNTVSHSLKNQKKNQKIKTDDESKFEEKYEIFANEPSSLKNTSEKKESNFEKKDEISTNGPSSVKNKSEKIVSITEKTDLSKQEVSKEAAYESEIKRSKDNEDKRFHSTNESVLENDEKIKYLTENEIIKKIKDNQSKFESNYPKQNFKESKSRSRRSESDDDEQNEIEKLKFIKAKRLRRDEQDRLIIKNRNSTNQHKDETERINQRMKLKEMDDHKSYIENLENSKKKDGEQTKKTENKAIEKQDKVVYDYQKLLYESQTRQPESRNPNLYNLRNEEFNGVNQDKPNVLEGEHVGPIQQDYNDFYRDQIGSFDDDIYGFDDEEEVVPDNGNIEVEIDDETSDELKKDTVQDNSTIPNEDVKNEDVKNDDVKNDDGRNDDVKKDDMKKNDMKKDDMKKDDMKKDDMKNDDGKDEKENKNVSAEKEDGKGEKENEPVKEEGNSVDDKIEDQTKINENVQATEPSVVKKKSRGCFGKKAKVVDPSPVVVDVVEQKDGNVDKDNDYPKSSEMITSSEDEKSEKLGTPPDNIEDDRIPSNYKTITEVHSDDDNQKELLIPENEINNPKYWKKNIFYIEPKAIFEQKIACIIRVKPGQIHMRKLLNCDLLLSSDELPSLDLRENYTSYIFKIYPKTSEDADKLNFDAVWHIAIPYYLPESCKKQPQIMHVNEDHKIWQECTTYEAIFDDIKLTSLKFVETKQSKPFGTFAVVSYLNKDKTVVDKEGTQLTSTTDRNVVFTVPPDALKITINTTLQVTTFDPIFWKEIKEKHEKSALDSIFLSSPIVEIEAKKKKLINPAILTLTLPTDAPKVERSVLKKKITEDLEYGDDKIEDDKNLTKKVLNSFQKTLLMPDVNSAKNVQDMHFLSYINEEERWNRIENPNINCDKSKDLMHVELPAIQSSKYILLKSKRKTNDETVTKAAKIIDNEFCVRNCVVALMQSTKMSSDFALVVSMKKYFQNNINKLQDEGYIVDQNNKLIYVELKERQAVTMEFVGNIRCLIPDIDGSQFAFHSLFPNTQKFRVREIDPYAQKAILSFRGYLDLYTKSLVKKAVPGIDGKVRKNQTQYTFVEENTLICHLLISIKKGPTPKVKAFSNLKICFRRFHKCIDVIKKLSAKIGLDWWDLGLHLNVTETRMHSIKLHNQEKGIAKMAEEMLIFWLKGCETNENKYDLLIHALKNCGRLDVIERIQRPQDRYLVFGC